MRARLAIFALIGALVAAALAIRSSEGSSPYRFSAVFDSARDVVSGITVKIAGTPVGTVQGVHLTSDYKARMDLEVPRRFGPFHDDATCQILPEGVISENYVQCDPGTAAQPDLAAPPHGLPTVPVSHTTVPVSLQDFIEIFSAPVNERLQLMLNELGLATAGEGDNINSILLRANPALTQTQRVLGIIDAQREQLGTAVAQTDRVVAELASHRDDVRKFVDQAAAVTTTTAAHQASLGQLFHRLPPLLTRLKTSARAVDQIAVNGAPLLTSLKRAAPALTALDSVVPRFTSPATPALGALGSATAEGLVADRSTSPVAGHLRSFAQQGASPSNLLDQLLTSMRDEGAIEGLLDFGYVVAGSYSTFDTISHMAGFVVEPTPCAANANGANCNHNYYAELGEPNPNGSSASSPAPSAKRSRPTLATGGHSSPSGSVPKPTGTPSLPLPSVPKPPKPGKVPLPPLPKLPPVPGSGGATGPGGVTGPGGGQAPLHLLLDYLLG